MQEEEEEAEEWSSDFQISTLLTLEALIGFWFFRGVTGTRSYLHHKLSRVKRHLVQVGSRGS